MIRQQMAPLYINRAWLVHCVPFLFATEKRVISRISREHCTKDYTLFMHIHQQHNATLVYAFGSQTEQRVLNRTIASFVRYQKGVFTGV